MMPGKRSTMGLRIIKESTASTQRDTKQDSANGLPEIVPDLERIQKRALDLRPDLAEEEPDTISFPFKAHWTALRRQLSKQRAVPADRAAEQTPVTEQRRSGKPKRPSLRELRNHQPDRLSFQAIEAKEEVDDDWYELVMLSLFLRVHSFVKGAFGDNSLSTHAQEWTTDPWLEKFSDDFVYYASQVSRGDPLMGGWDALLNMPVERTYLITGIIARVLSSHVFSKLLFGADEYQQQMLHSQDVATISYDGYQRTAMRAEAVKVCLDGVDSQPTGFWPAVDQLALQTTALLLPLIKLRDQNSTKEDWPSLRDLHQQIHNIVAEAGFLSNMMRRSSSVFRIEFPSPGEMWNLDQEHVHDAIYKSSEQAGIAYDNDEHQRLAREAQKSKKVLEVQPIPARVARVQIALWPNVKRFAPVKTVKGLPSEGERRSTIIKSQVVYYSGPEDDNVIYPGLFTHIKYRTLQKARKFHTLLGFVWLLLCLALLWKAYTYHQSGAWTGWQHQIGGIKSKISSSIGEYC